MHFTYTFTIACVLIMLALIGLGLGHFVAKKKLKNRCGQKPQSKEPCDSSGSCDMCNPSKKETP